MTWIASIDDPFFTDDWKERYLPHLQSDELTSVTKFYFVGDQI